MNVVSLALHNSHWIGMKHFHPIGYDAEQLADLDAHALVFRDDIGLDHDGHTFTKDKGLRRSPTGLAGA